MKHYDSPFREWETILGNRKFYLNANNQISNKICISRND